MIADRVYVDDTDGYVNDGAGSAIDADATAAATYDNDDWS